MGYNIVIGNAVPVHSKDDFPRLSARWEVEAVTLDEAPGLPNDVNGKSNARFPSYSVWTDFCEATGLRELFFDKEDGLFAHHPGCEGITQKDVEQVSAALKGYRTRSRLPPGFEKHPYRSHTYDEHLARLIWLEFWMRWAVKNCETPAIQNG